ncbi:ATP-binding cassette domain-containing protein [Cryobacterium breve]|uniref:ATP-binding cassette domain-containing protein n=1 Tax=Cryobacterium breve TaxID=1259258 RepID=UPI00248AA23A|nr:ATP-binding cassette domain-containing protein [Cryobacterium breve]
MNPQPLVTLQNVGKTFGQVTVIKDVTVSVYAGHVQVLLGENGAGKSTLIKMMAGVYQPDAGHIVVDGAIVTLPTTRAAEDLGIATIHQEPQPRADHERRRERDARADADQARHGRPARPPQPGACRPRPDRPRRRRGHPGRRARHRQAAASSRSPRRSASTRASSSSTSRPQHSPGTRPRPSSP